MNVQTFLLVCSLALLILSGIIHVWKGNLKFFGQDFKQFAINDVEFTRFRRTYTIGHLIVLFADSLQASYTYYVFDWYIVSWMRIAQFYAAGLVANLLATLFLYRWLQKVERRLACFLHCVLACMACYLKSTEKETMCLLSRLFDGVAAVLLLAPFQEWYMHEHLHKYGFPAEWVQITFRTVSIYSTVLAVLAGHLADFLHRNFLDPSQVILLGMPILSASSLWICWKWSPNRAEANGSTEGLLQGFTRSFRIISRRPSILLLCTLQALYESSYILFLYVWTPLFLQFGEIESNMPYTGAVYGCLMAGMLLGIVIYCKLSMHLLAPNLLSVATALSFTGMFATVIAAFPDQPSATRCNLTILFLVIYQLGSGIYFPTTQRLQKDILPADDRSSIVCLFRVPLNLLAIFSLLLLAPAKHMGNWSTLCVSASFNCGCLIMSFKLARMIKQSNVDYFMLDLKSDKEGEV